MLGVMTSRLQTGIVLEVLRQALLTGRVDEDTARELRFAWLQDQSGPESAADFVAAAARAIVDEHGGCGHED